METIFPTDTGYAGLFIIGFRKVPPSPPNDTQRTGTVILKRTYEIDTNQGTLRPSMTPLPIFLTDQPRNPAGNGDFEYEHDLAPFKPTADLIVLGFADVIGMAQLNVNRNRWLAKGVMNTGGDLFGWEARTGTTREGQAGTFSQEPNDYPPQWPVDNIRRDPLPSDFNNAFFNGHLRNFVTTTPAYLPADAEISIIRPETDNYTFNLASETVRANYFIYRGTGPDRDDCWQRVEVGMNLDTLVIEPERDRCYAVWRGVWNYDNHSPDRYRRLVISS